MSGAATGWAWKVKCGSSTERVVLLALADHAGPGDNPQCWPSQGYLSNKCHLSRETINRTLRSLRDRGLVEAVRRKDSGGRDIGCIYRLITNLGVTHDHTGVTHDHFGCDVGSQGGVTYDHTEPSKLEPSIEPSSVTNVTGTDVPEMCGYEKNEPDAPRPENDFIVLSAERASPTLFGFNDEPQAILKPPEPQKAVDPWVQVYAVGKSLLARYGYPDREAGGMISRWRKSVPDPNAMLAIFLDAGKAEREDIIPWITGAAKARSGKGKKQRSTWQMLRANRVDA